MINIRCALGAHEWRASPYVNLATGEPLCIHCSNCRAIQSPRRIQIPRNAWLAGFLVGPFFAWLAWAIQRKRPGHIIAATAANLAFWIGGTALLTWLGSILVERMI